MKELSGFYPEEIKYELAGHNIRSFQAEQIFTWLQKGKDFDSMTNISLKLRSSLKENYLDQVVGILETHTSRIDGTKKYLFSLKDGNCIEGVLMKYHYGNTLCVSTQVGCNMGCAFCASTLGGKVRDLTAAEILGQVHAVNATLENEEKVNHIVMMGAGEPLDNYENVLRFIRLVSHPKGLNISVRHLSLSTCGLADQVRRFAQEGLPVTLSLSLHAPNDHIRGELMPISRRYSIRETLDACRYYVEKTGRRLIIEYALIKGKNNSEENAHELARILRGFQCHVNLIPLNTVKERNLLGVNEKEISLFLSVLEQDHISVTRRREMGDDIEGACGQLRRRRLREDMNEG